MDKIFGKDRITIGERHTFRKSEIQGISSEWKSASHGNYIYAHLSIIMNGNKIEVFKEMLSVSEDSDYFERDEKLKEFHKKWEERLNNIPARNKPERKYI